ncbi:MAG: hypothetical protein ABI867_29390 [Kofleriaceae bacterium]
MGEHVELTASEPGVWNGMVASERFLWIAQSTGGVHAVTFQTQSGAHETITFDVVAPEIDFRLARVLAYPAGQQGAGMVTEVQFLPFTVSFANVQWRESAGPASAARGYFATQTPPDHAPNPAWLPVGTAADTAACWGFPAPWSAGSFDWQIAQRYKVAGEPGDGHLIGRVTQHVALADDGTTTITKGNASTSRSAGPATDAPTRGTATGFGDLFDVIAGVHPALAAGVNEAARLSGHEQLAADIRASIASCPKHIKQRLDRLTAQQLAEITNVAANLMAAEMVILVLAALPEPTIASKVVAVVLQVLLLVLAFHIAFTESVAAFHSALAWWKVIKDANGNPAEIEKSSGLFAELILHMVQAIGAAIQVTTIGLRGIRVPEGHLPEAIHPDRTVANPSGDPQIPRTRWGKGDAGARLLAAGEEAGIQVKVLESLSEADRGHLVAAQAAVDSGDIHAAIKHFDHVEPRLGTDATRKLEAAIAQRAGKSAPEIYRNPHATLPDGQRVEPNAWGGTLYHGTTISPEAVFESGLAGRGSETSLVQHLHQRNGSAFRGTTKQVFYEPGGTTGGGAGSWADAGGWVYEIDGTPSFDVNANLYGRVKQPDGSYAITNVMGAEHEHAILANVPRERIRGAYPILRDAAARLTKGSFVPNPHYRALK